MARKIRLTPYDERYDEQLLEEHDGADGAEYMTYGRAPSTAAEDDYLPDDPMPLFLSNNDDEEDRRRGFGRGRLFLCRQSRRTVRPCRIRWSWR